MIENNYSRRAFISSSAFLLTALSSPVHALTFTIEYVFTVPSGETVFPDQYSYDMIEFEDDGVLAFEDGDTFVFGDENPPQQGTTQPVVRTIDLPLEIDLHSMEQGVAFFLVGVMSTLLAAIYLLRNYAAGIAWSFSFIFLILAGLFGMGLEVYWMGIVGTVMLLVVGMVVQFQQA